MKRLKQILAMAGVVILLAMYVVTLISAILVTPATKKLFMASIAATIMVPILIYVLILLFRLTMKGGEQNLQEGEKPALSAEEKKGFDEAFGKQGKKQGGNS